MTDATVATELLETVCSSVPALSKPFVCVRLKFTRESEAEPDAVLVTVVTAPMPLTVDFCTISSLVLSRTRSCMGMG